MGLRKPVVMENGVTVEYFRIVHMDVVVNVQCDIEVCGYIDHDARVRQLAAYESGEPDSSYTDTRFFCAPYDEAMGVKDAYNWLKSSVPMFEGAEDVM